MGKTEYNWGHATIQEFFDWINARHAIFLKKNAGEPKPWSDDPIFLDYKFTNAFRELDTGTIALRDMLKDQEEPELIIFNIMWYRMLNYYKHAEDIGFVDDIDTLIDQLRAKKLDEQQIFTGSHMTYSYKGMSKLEFHVRTFREIWAQRKALVLSLSERPTLKDSYDTVKEFCGVGPFIAYEMVTDFRWYPQLWGPLDKPTDTMTWASIGPGAKRGLERLGMAEHLSSLVRLLKEAIGYASEDVLKHIIKTPTGVGDREFSLWPPFELREIEHSLCEFDKYQRVKTGAGRPRQRYEGRE